MQHAHSSRITAVLGPTNTGKTHLAIERMCAHSSGMMAFPLRLLAREVYDRVVAIKGAEKVALLTGEERILPPNARYYLCTAEAMPIQPDVAFLALDEAQLGGDPERGHVFTARLLHSRGREETMILGSATLAPIIRALVPEAEIVSRPRFSTLSFAGSAKISRLPKRSVIVTFSAQDVYATAEALRRMRGGAAVVLGALSPRTRNAQVALFQSGQVDYLVATDAIGMGLNLDVTHIAFASLTKFDGRRQRRLTTAEMAQIAGRAGRHQRDGSFGLLSGQGLEFTPEEVERLESHHLQKMSHLYWRDAFPDFSSLNALIASLEAPPHHPHLLPAPLAVDLAVLKWLADDPDVRAAAAGEDRLRTLWECCSIPDFQSLGADHHGRLVQRIWGYRSSGAGKIDHQWATDQLARLDRVDGDMDTLSARIAAVRVWCYIAQRPDWLGDAPLFAGRSREIENRLSDALHNRLRERFIDVRTQALLRGAAKDGHALVAVDDDGSVTVDGADIGQVTGFRFTPDAAARGPDRKRMIAAADRHLAHYFAQQATMLAAAPDTEFALGRMDSKDTKPALSWRGITIAELIRGKAPLLPGVELFADLNHLPAAGKHAIADRLRRWITDLCVRTLPSLMRLDGALNAGVAPDVRAIGAMLIDQIGPVPRADIAENLDKITPADRAVLNRMGFRIAMLDVWATDFLRPAAVNLRCTLAAAWRREALPDLPLALLQAQPRITAAATQGLSAHWLGFCGYRLAGGSWLRIDMIERLARAAHQARLARKADSGETALLAGFTPDSGLATSLGLSAADYAAVLRLLGFRMHADGSWIWKPRRKPHISASQEKQQKPSRHALTVFPPSHNAFAGLASLLEPGQ
jgi:ATP-dependent RNA helicase SUPV3L1/SUV3